MAKTIITLHEGSVDRLGMLLAQIADLTKEADAIKDAIKDAGESMEGNLFKAAYIESNRMVFDKAAFVTAQGQELYDRFVKPSAVFSVKVTAR
jgi:hypothetical protein